MRSPLPILLLALASAAFAETPLGLVNLADDTVDSVRERDWKLIRSLEHREELYDLKRDPGELEERLEAALKEDPERVVERQKFFGEIIRDEDYVAAAASQVGADSGLQDTVVFGRNEPALHHYHNTYREALGMELLPLLEA